ncbi:unnamed protein product [Albugo candida]|uniref:Uncharacterized protein n=1 Tax=Albugo candida TaxID=65357 RepID=A0A024G0M8_9STRA|nr:unnamed protein product [Albugo candida]|eukprot:CCI40220.1 unnamed protein product [Albugo candida]
MPILSIACDRVAKADTRDTTDRKVGYLVPKSCWKVRCDCAYTTAAVSLQQQHYCYQVVHDIETITAPSPFQYSVYTKIDSTGWKALNAQTTRCCDGFNRYIVSSHCSHNKRHFHAIDEFFRQDDDTKRKLNQADVEAVDCQMGVILYLEARPLILPNNDLLRVMTTPTYVHTLVERCAFNVEYRDSLRLIAICAWYRN